MDTNVVSAIISGLFSLSICFASYMLGKKGTDYYPRNIKEMQLKNVLEPLALIVRANDFSFDGYKQEITKIIDGNYSLVPTKVLSSYNSLQNSEGGADGPQCFKLIVETNFEWTKKRLQYPFDKSKIRHEYIPTRERNDGILLFVQTIVFMLWIISVAAVFLLLFQPSIRNSPDPITQKINSVSLIIFSFGFFFLAITGYFHKK